MRRTIVFADPQAFAPANIGGSVALVRDLRALDTEASRDASQPNVAQRPLLGRAPLVGRRNLLLNTEDLDDDYWDKRNGLTVTDEGAGVFRLNDASHETPRRYVLRARSGGWVMPPGPRTISVEVKAGSIDKVVFAHQTSGTQSAGGGNSTIFDIAAGQFSSVGGSFVATSVQGLGDGWFRISASRNDADSTSFRGFTLGMADGDYAGDGTGTLFIRFPQAETGLAPTPYQRIGTSDLDITEPVTGLPSPTFLRLDLSDDQLVHAFPEGFVGEVLIFGRNASWIAPDVTVAPGGTLTIGPQGIAGLPEAFLAHLGDIVGWVPIGQSLDTQARAALLTHYRPKGARPFVPALFEGASWDDAALWRDVVNITGAET